MKKKVKNNLINAGIILVILIVIYFSLIPKSTPTTEIEIVECIGEKSTLYVQLGCKYCDVQEELFSENVHSLNIIDCFYEPERCQGVSSTPTWEIKNDYYVGVQQIETLRELTGC